MLDQEIGRQSPYIPADIRFLRQVLRLGSEFVVDGGNIVFRLSYPINGIDKRLIFVNDFSRKIKFIRHIFNQEKSRLQL